MKPDRLDALTSLRFFAAFAVVMHHLTNGRIGAAAHGVAFFFALSGFILTYTYPSLPSWRERRLFIVNRFARLWPAHATALIVVIAASSAPLLSMDRWSATWALAVNLLMVQTWAAPFGNFPYSINPVSWSISTEFAFYFCFIFLIQNFDRTWWWKLAGTALLAAGLIWFATYLNLTWLDPTRSMDVSRLLYLFPGARLIEFTAGMCAALAWRTYRPKVRISSPLSWTAIELAAVLLVACTVLACNAPLGVTPFPLWLGSSSITIPALLLIVVFAFNGGWISAALSARPFVFLGEISYSVYLLHGIVIYVFFNKYQNSMETTALYMLCVAVTLIISWLVWWLVETPARLAIRRIAAGWDEKPSEGPILALPPKQPMGHKPFLQPSS